MRRKDNCTTTLIFGYLNSKCFLPLITAGIFMGVILNAYSQEMPQPPKVRKSSEVTLKVKKVPYAFEYPTDPLLLKVGESADKPWKVYSEANGNQTFSNPNLHTPLNKINFLDSFYVKNETKDALELIKCTPGLLINNSLQVADNQKIVWNGWIEKSKLLLSEKSFLDPNNRRPIKSLTIANGHEVLVSLKEGTNLNSLKVYNGPTTDTEITKKILFGEVVYVYKESKDRVLIGRSPSFKSNLTEEILTGWVFKDLVQNYGQRLNLETNYFQKEGRNLLYQSKDSSILKLSGSPQGHILKGKECEISKAFQKNLPVFKYETILNGKEKVSVFQTGTILNVFDKTKSFIYNVNGAKISYTDLCEMHEKSKNINIVLAINQASDSKEYMLALNKALQELSVLFEQKEDDIKLMFGVTDCNSLSGSFKLDLTTKYPEITDGIAKMLRKGIEEKNSGSLNGSIINGLINASKLLKGREYENNVIILVSSQADNIAIEAANKVLKESAMNELAKLNGRLLFMQPYCGTNPSYAGFVQQAKMLIKSSSEKKAVLKREKMVGNERDNSNLNIFRPILNGSNNIYCLDYPLNANNQGVLIFPTIGNKIEDKAFRAGLDTLLCQIVKENENIIATLNQVFESPNSYNVKINHLFQKYYSRYKPLASDLPTTLKNMSYQYFAPGYISYTESGTRPVKQSLFLSEAEYDEIVNLFKDLLTDQIGVGYDMKSRTASYQAILKIIRRYSDERQTHLKEYISFADFFEEIVGYRPENNLLKKYKIADLIATNSQIKEDMKLLVAYLNSRFLLFYEIKQLPGQGFSSNGMKYYQVPEKYLP